MAAKKKPARRAKKTTPKSAAKRAPAKKPAPKMPIVRKSGERLYWLLKTEPESFSFADLLAAKNATTTWDGVRNYQARNFLRDSMKLGDGVFIYHSNQDPPAIVGVAEVAREGYVDPTQFDPAHHHYDPDSDSANPPWFMVDVKAMRPMARALGLPELHTVPGLQKMLLLQKGSRLSVQPVSESEWKIIASLA